MRLSAACVILALFVGGIASESRAQNIEADFIFVIDATDSMRGEIAAVKAGLGEFVTGLDLAEIDARFAVVLYGGAPELIQDFSSDPVETEMTFDTISVDGAVVGFQNNHNVNPEAGLEAIRITLGASAEQLDRTNVGGVGGLVFRPDARVNIILVTDEDADQPFYGSNRLPGQTSQEPPGSIAGTDWQTEVDTTAQAVIDNEVFLNLLINPNDTPSRSQYGDPASDVSDADLLNFDPDATLMALELAGFKDSLEAQVLRADLIGRSFTILDVDDPVFVANFFRAKIEEIVGQIFILPPLLDLNPIGEPHTVTARVFDVGVGPLPDVEITITVLSGPNAGQTDTGLSDIDGEFELTYVGTGGPGIDAIVASFVNDSGDTITSDPALKFWDDDCQENGIPDTCDLSCGGFEGACAEFADCGLSADDDANAVPDECNMPPVCDAAAATVDELWPPNHRIEEVGVVGVSDPDGDPITITIDAIAQDEPVWASGQGAGETRPDGVGVGAEVAGVRAERNGNPKTPGDGRVYHISFTADDGQGGSCSGVVNVCVPHDQRPGTDCVDGGPLFSSTACGIGGFELAFLLPGLIWLRRRRRRTPA